MNVMYEAARWYFQYELLVIYFLWFPHGVHSVSNWFWFLKCYIKVNAERFLNFNQIPAFIRVDFQIIRLQLKVKLSTNHTLISRGASGRSTVILSTDLSLSWNTNSVTTIAKANFMFDWSPDHAAWFPNFRFWSGRWRLLGTFRAWVEQHEWNDGWNFSFGRGQIQFHLGKISRLFLKRGRCYNWTGGYLDFVRNQHS